MPSQPVVFVGPTPAAGAEARVDRLAPGVYQVLAIRFALTTSAAIADRLPALVVTHQGQEVWRVVAPATQPASTTRVYVAAAAVDRVADTTAGFVLLPLPPLLLLTDLSSVATSTGSIQAADQYSPLTLFVAPCP